MFDFCISVFSLESEDLRYIYAYLAETTLWSALAGNVSDFFSKTTKGESTEGQSFQRRIEKAVLRYKAISDEEVRFRLLAELAVILRVPFTNLTSRKDCVDLCKRIISETVTLYRKHNSSFTGATEQDLVTSVIHNIILRVAEDVDPTDGDIEEMATRTEEFLQTLPANQQEEIRCRLGVDDLSKSMLKRLITQGSIGTVFAVAIDAAGFAAYKGAVVALASAAKLIGMTLPFGIYMKLTSLIAVLSNPITLIGLIGGGGLLVYKSQSKDVRERFLPVLVCLVMLNQYSSCDLSVIDQRMDAMIEFWQQRFSTYTQLDGFTESLSNRLRQEQMILRRSTDKRNKALQTVAMQHSSLKSLTDAIAASLAANDEIVVQLTSMGPARSEARRYHSLKGSVIGLSAVKPWQGSLTFSSLVSGIKHGFADVRLKIEMNLALHRTAEVVLESLPGPVPSGLSGYSEEARKIRAIIADARQRQSHAEREIDASERICSDLMKERRRLEADMDQMRRDMPVLEEVYSRLRQVGV